MDKIYDDDDTNDVFLDQKNPQVGNPITGTIHTANSLDHGARIQTFNSTTTGTSLDK